MVLVNFSGRYRVVKTIIIACLLALASELPLVAVGDEAASAHTPAYSSSDTLIGDLLDSPATRAILDKYLPGFSTAEQIDSARYMTLRSVQQFAPETITDEILAKIDADLAKLPASKHGQDALP